MENENPLCAESLIYAYAQGYFPMADDQKGLQWFNPDPRAIIPLYTYKPAKSLRPILNKGLFEIRVDTQFESVMRACSMPRSEEDGVWISEEMVLAYTELHRLGFAHSVEAYLDNQLVGGLYGVSIGAVFCGESMFSKVPNSSKVAFHYLIQILNTNQFELLDTQFINDNVLRYGAIEISRDTYLRRLAKALKKNCKFELINTL
jgi:leucyl/phenylalanyl-tRNA--protein transferase